MKGLVIGGTHSGAGKTTLSLALMAALRARGLTVQAFKVGPDFIDTGHHGMVTGRPSHNLDTWMLPADENLNILRRYARQAQVAVVEGVMGLYDGFSALSQAGSTAEMAKLLGLPVLLAADAGAMARSFAALASGYLDFDPELSWAGVAANRVAGPAHADILRQAMEQLGKAPLLACLPRRPELALAERHLGLVTAEEGGLGREDAERLAAWLNESLDLDQLLESLPEIELPGGEDSQDKPLPEEVPIAVARDQAFCFYYQENLRRLRRAGARLMFFSPLRDRALPPGIAGLYLGGGYPELFAEALSENAALREEIARLGRDGLPIYAECGGMMYLGQELRDLDGREWPMAGLLPISCQMLAKLKSLGYREVSLKRPTVLGPVGTRARGHEFHYSEIAGMDSQAMDCGCYEVSGPGGGGHPTQGFALKNTLASYVHLHFGSNPELAQGLVESCRAYQADDKI